MVDPAGMVATTKYRPFRGAPHLIKYPKEKNPKYKQEKPLRRILLMLFLLFVLITLVNAYKDRQALLNPTGEYGTVQEVGVSETSGSTEEGASESTSSTSVDGIPEYSGIPTYVINDNKPQFTDEEYEKAKEAYVKLSPLDHLGRCGTCEASLGKEMLDSAGERRDISQIHPSGWHQASYPELVETEGGWLYHRSHLIAHMFAGADPEVDGEKNLITATEYCNEKGMLPYVERAVQNWLIRKADGGRVLYRVTPVFKGSELVARGVHIEAADVETKGTAFHINVWCYNVEPGVKIDYMTGMSWAD